MDEISRAISKNIESGKYYKDAREWFYSQYVFPFTQRLIVLVLATFLLGVVFVVFNTFNSLMPLKTVIPFPMYFKDVDRTVPILKSLLTEENGSTEDVNKVIIHYLLKNYVATRETYAYGYLDEQTRRIKNTSSKAVFKQFENYHSPQNKQNPRNRFGAKISRKPIIQSVTLLGSSQVPDSARVKFKIEIRDNTIILSSKDKDSNVIGREYWSVDIKFSFFDIYAVKRKEFPFEFIVTEYNARQLKHAKR